MRKLPFRLASTKRLATFLFAAIAWAPAAVTAGAESRCWNVNGHYAEHAVPPSTCLSPAELCIEGEFSGGVRGAFAVTTTSLTPTADTPITGVVLFTGDGVIHARVGSREGDLLFKSSGAFHTVGGGEIVDLQVITGGTGELAGASGAFRASGTFDSATGSGESEYTGAVCLP
jgi:hypothetical protein